MQYIIKKLFVIFFVFIYQVVNPLAAKGGVKANNETTNGWISKVIWGHRAGRRGARWDYFWYSTQCKL